MCGIAGIVNLAGTEVHQLGALHSMTKCMARRGPDSSGFVLIGGDGRLCALLDDATSCVSPGMPSIEGFPVSNIRDNLATRSRAALGHRRLSILDLSPHGHQPMSTPDRRYSIVYNGEIYNYEQIARDLAAEGVVLRSRSDTEVLLQAYVRWGKPCLHRLNGDFAFALWDNATKSLFCARDRIGVKPFYYTIQDGQFVFASDIKAIIASGLYTPEPDARGLYLAMAFGIAPRPLTAFKGVRSLEQGHWMEVASDGRLDIRPYWQISTGRGEPDMREEDAVEWLGETLVASVKRRLVADVPVGTFMSGGVDSTLVSAIASRLQPGIKAFTLAFESTSSELDEVPQAMATARMHPMEHVVLRVDPAMCLGDLDDWVAGYEEPYFGLAANHVVAALARSHGVKVVLNGLGGDELFAGYRYYRQRRLWQAARMLRPVMGLSGLIGRRGRYLATLSRASSATRYHTAAFMHFPEADLQELFASRAADGMSAADQVEELYANNRTFSNDVEAVAYMDMMNYLGNHHVHRIDQFTMACSIEGRFPFLDHELVELAFRIPSTLKIRNGVQKYVLRKLAARYIAPACLAMGKKGFSLPLEEWMAGPLRATVLDAVTSLKQREMFSAETIDRFYLEYERGERGASHIWHLVALELWFRKFIDSPNHQCPT